MKIVSWNVNGIRAVIKKGFYDFMNEYNPDIICIQETKAHKDQVDLILEEYPYKYWNSAKKKGYSGTAIFSKIEPLSFNYYLNIEKHDQEGRVITLEFEKYFLVTVYTPNAKRDLSRLDYRSNEWDKDFLKFVKNLEKKLGKKSKGKNKQRVLDIDIIDFKGLIAINKVHLPHPRMHLRKFVLIPLFCN